VSNTGHPRDVMLREMGITPIWHTRGVALEQNAGEPTVASVAQTRDDAPSLRVAADEVAHAPATSAPHAVPIVSANAAASHEDRATRIGQMNWDELIADIAQCTACKLCTTRNRTVPGVGYREPVWMVVGEAPGENEDRQGEPFVGRAGQLLDAMLAAVGKSRRRDVFIVNVIKCRPPGNRNPEADEIAACAPYLARQIQLAQPKLLLAAGKFAAQQLLATDATVAAMRAAPGEHAGIPVVVTYHPSYLLRSPAEKAKAWDDLATARALTPKR
jgi:uracil-DNA glycosylase